MHSSALHADARRGVFVTFEGVDGAGKTTQCSLLCDALRSAGYEVVRLREPGGTPLGERVRSLLLDPQSQTIDPTCELLLFEAARAQLVAQVVRPALDRGAVVVSDRFFDSTYAYQGFARGLGGETVRTVNAVACGGLAPDRTLLLDLGFNPEAVVVVLNGKAARHNAFGSTAVRDGDVLEVEEIEGGREG